jgi:nucleosome assembly protein 1-like 1
MPPTAGKKEEPELNDNEKDIVTELKKLYLNTVNLDVNLQRDIYFLEKDYESKHHDVFDKRLKVLQDFRKKVANEKGSESSVNNFWLTVLKASYTEFISKRDEKILSFLVDIRSKLYNDPEVKFVLEFTFEPNEYFQNKVLTKTYFLKCVPDADNPFTYDGAEIYKCEGCEIKWSPDAVEKEIKRDFLFSSFFDFFDPPKLPENPEDPKYAEINASLQNDFEIGFYIKERVIPKAVLFFTGEISDCQSSEESESESEDEDDEYDNENEDDRYSSPNEYDTSNYII